MAYSFPEMFGAPSQNSSFLPFLSTSRLSLTTTTTLSSFQPRQHTKTRQILSAQFKILNLPRHRSESLKFGKLSKQQTATTSDLLTNTTTDRSIDLEDLNVLRTVSADYSASLNPKFQPGTLQDTISGTSLHSLIQ